MTRHAVTTAQTVTATAPQTVTVTVDDRDRDTVTVTPDRDTTAVTVTPTNRRGGRQGTVTRHGGPRPSRRTTPTSHTVTAQLRGVTRDRDSHRDSHRVTVPTTSQPVTVDPCGRDLRGGQHTAPVTVTARSVTDHQAATVTPEPVTVTPPSTPLVTVTGEGRSTR